MSDPKFSSIQGTFTLTDGTTTSFSISPDAGWRQWGATTKRLGLTSDVLDDRARAAAEYMGDEEEEE